MSLDMTGKDADTSWKKKIRISGCVWHGELWSPEVYSNLICGEMPASTPSSYAKSLVMRGITSATNGFGVLKMAYDEPSSDAPLSDSVHIQSSHPQLWQALCMNKNGMGTHLKSQIFQQYKGFTNS